MSPTGAALSPTIIAAIDAMGVEIHLHAAEGLPDDVRAQIEEAWRDCRVTPRVNAGRHRTLELTPHAFSDAGRGLSDLSTRVTLEALDELRGTHLLLHAAGVATDDGRTIALVGPSGRGKTTASRRLGTHFAYVSDETVAVTDDLSIQPYRKPLSIISDGLDHKEQIAPSALGLKDLPDAALRLVGLTLIERRPDAEEVGPVVIDTIDAVCEMTPQISYLPERDTPLQHLARVFDAVGAPTRLIYRDAVDLPELVQEMFDAPMPRAAEWTVPRRGTARGAWRAAPYDDALIVSGRACVLREGTVTALDQRGRLVWTACLAGATTEEIVAAAVEEFGAPGEGDAAALIDATIEELRAFGFLEAT